MTEGAKVVGRMTKALRFADDQAILAGSKKGLQKTMDQLNKISTESDMKMNNSDKDHEPKQRVVSNSILDGF